MKVARGPKTPILTALPAVTAADDGLEILFLVDVANSIAWKLRYRAFQADGVTPNPNTYKWECIGGQYLLSGIDAAVGMPAFLPSPTPSIIVPLAGEYEYDHGALLNNNGSASSGYTVAGLTVDGAAFMTGTNGGTTQVQQQYGPGQAGVGIGSVTSRRGVIATAAGANVRQGYGVNTTGQCSNRFLRLRPVRVG